MFDAPSEYMVGSHGAERAGDAVWRLDAVLARSARPLVMWGTTVTDNVACHHAFRAAGGSPDEGEIFMDYRWPPGPDEGDAA